MATKQKARTGKTALKAEKKPAAPKTTTAKRAAQAKPVAKKATASFRGGAQVVARAPAARGTPVHEGDARASRALLPR
jgi:hypothetical protein